ncbi:PA domain-containing protein [Kitasatospora aburaviensis]
MAGSPGHDQSARYVYEQARRAGLKVSRQEFEYTFFQELTERLSVVSPRAEDVRIKAMTYSAGGPEGGLTAQLAVVPEDATTGCEAADYAAGAFTGRIALIKRGGCSFAVKQAAAAEAGALAAVVYNNIEGTSTAPSATRGPAGSRRPAPRRRPASRSPPRPPPDRSPSPWTCAPSWRSAPPGTSSPRPAAATIPTPSWSAPTWTPWWRARASTTTAPVRPASWRSPRTSPSGR